MNDPACVEHGVKEMTPSIEEGAWCIKKGPEASHNSTAQRCRKGHGGAPSDEARRLYADLRVNDRRTQ